MRKYYLLLIISLAVIAQDKADFQFGLIADCQYCDQPTRGARYYSISDKKLKDCVNQLNKLPLKYVVHLGDFIDKDFKSFAVVSPIYKSLKMPSYHVLGNHDFDVADDRKKDVLQALGMTSKYYDFKVNDWRFIVLDGNDVSFHAYPKTSKEYAIAQDYYKTKKIKSPKWNGAIGEKQLSWVEERLKMATKAGEKVAFYCHFPVYPANNHNLWNADEFVALIEKFDCVKAYINGHNHKGNYAIKKGIHYLTIKGMVDTKESSFATASVFKNTLMIKGFGRETDRVLKLK